MKYLVFLTVVLLAPPVAAAGKQEQVLNPHLSTTVHVERILYPFRIVATKGEPLDGSFCAGFTADSFVFHLNGKRRPFEAIDYLGALEIGPAVPQKVVFVFDDRHMDGKPPGLERCPSRMHAYAMAREVVRSLQAPWRLLVVTIANGVFIHPAGWIEDTDTALGALDDMELDPFLTTRIYDSVHEKNWWEELRTLFAALRVYQGSKDVLWFAADLDPRQWLDAYAAEFGSWVQSANATVYAVDTISSQRVTPQMLFAFAQLGGGKTLTDFSPVNTISHAADVAFSKACHFQVVLALEQRDVSRWHINEASVDFVDPHPGLRILGPGAIWNPFMPRSPEERLQALLFARGGCEHGLRIAASFGIREGGYADLLVPISLSKDGLKEDLSQGIVVDTEIWRPAARRGERNRIIWSERRLVAPEDARSICDRGLLLKLALPEPLIPGTLEVSAAVVAVASQGVEASIRWSGAVTKEDIAPTMASPAASLRTTSSH